MDLYKVFIIYIIIINIIGLFSMSHDKKLAQEKHWRVPEARLFTIAALFGSIGIWSGMYLFHHKTKHIKFVLGVPAILILQCTVIAFAIKYI